MILLLHQRFTSGLRRREKSAGRCRPGCILPKAGAWSPPHVSLIDPTGRLRARKASSGCACFKAPSGNPVSAWKTRPMLASVCVVACRRQQRDAEGHAVITRSPPARASAHEIEQVDEIGVGAEPAVELDRIGQHLLQPCRRSVRSAAPARRSAESMVGDAAQFLQSVESREGVDCRRPQLRSTMISRVTG